MRYFKLLACASIFVLSFSSFGGKQEKKTAKESAAYDVVLWSMPFVAMDAMRQAYLRDAKAQYNDVVLLSQGWKNQITTPNSSSNYLYFNYNLKDGPVVVEIPAAVGGGVFGAFNNTWQIPLGDYGPKGTDQGKGGKYLLTPPDFKGQIPDGYIQVKSDTLNGYSVIRAIPISSSDADVKKVWELAYSLKVYPLSKAKNPPKQRFIDMRDQLFDGIAAMDDSYFQSVTRVLKDEPNLAVSGEMRNKLKAIAFENGKDISSADQKEVLRSAAQRAHKFIKESLVEKTTSFYSKGRWGMPTAIENSVKTGFTFKGVSDADRAVLFYFACAPAKTMGDASMYLTATTDAQGKGFHSNEVYKLHVPANVPVEQFWSVNIYDLDTAGFFKDAPTVGLDSYNRNMVKNSDGSVDIFFATKAPAGKGENWIPTPPGKNWFAIFRFYGPKNEIKTKKWTLPDIEKVSTNGLASIK